MLLSGSHYASRPVPTEAARSHEILVEALRRVDLDTVGEQMRSQFVDGAERLTAHLERVGLVTTTNTPAR